MTTRFRLPFFDKRRAALSRAKRASAQRSTARQLMAMARRFPLAAKRGPKSSGFVDLAYATYAMDTTGSITLVATMPQGTAVGERVGKKARYVSFQIRGRAVSGSSTTVADGAYLLVYDKRPTGSLPAITDVLNTVSSNSFNNDNNSGRFQIIRRWDHTFIGSTTAGNSTDATSTSPDMFIPFNKRVTFKSAGTGVIADIEEGAVYLITVGDQAAGAGAASLSIGIRTRFKDTDG